jgi:hypothetical protein
MVSLYEDVLIVGGADVGIGEPLPEKVRVATEEHWEIVTSHVAPGLKEVSEEGPGRSRYPVELNKGHQMELAHLAKLRGLARELGVDALHWALANEPGRAADSIVAILPLGNSLSEEPILISQLVRIAIFGIAQGNLEDLMNRVSFEDEELARIQSAFAQALPPLQEGVIFNRAMVGESVLGLSAIEKFWLFVSSVELSEQRSLTLLAPLRQLAFPASTERMFMGLFFEDMRKASRLPWHEFSGLVGGDQDERFEQSVAFAPLFGILVPALPRVYEAEWRIRTQLDIAVTALAVERYRLAVGRLPVQLSDLVPVFLSAVPTDFFSSTGSPIRYRSEADGNFVVYGVGRDMEDDHGVRMKNWSREGDIIFSIVSRGDG